MNRQSRRAFLRATAAAGVAGVAGCSGGGGQQPSDGQDGFLSGGGGTDWGGWGGDPGNSWAQPGATAVTGSVEETWQFGDAEVFALFSVAGGTVYAHGDSGVYALDAASGDVQWEKEISADKGVGPTVADRTIYLGTDEGRVSAFATEDGSEQWTFDRSEPFDCPAVVDGTVYVVGEQVYAFDANSGDVEWEYTPSGEVQGAIPAVTGGALYARTGDGGVFAVDTSDGSKLWDYTREGTTFRTPTVVNGRVYLGEVNGQEEAEVSLRALDASTGELDWEFATLQFASAPAVGNGSAYITTGTDELVALDAASGEEQWRLSDERGVIGPSLFGNTVYVSSESAGILAIAAGDGSQRLSVPLGDDVGSGTPLAVDGRLYVGVESEIRAYEPESA